MRALSGSVVVNEVKVGWMQALSACSITEIRSDRTHTLRRSRYDVEDYEMKGLCECGFGQPSRSLSPVSGQLVEAYVKRNEVGWSRPKGSLME